MTMTNQNNAVSHIGNGATTVWPYTFEIPTGTDVVTTLEIATAIESDPIDSSLYTISGLDDPAGGSVTYPLSGSPLASTHRINIKRIMPIEQTLNLTSQSAYSPEALEQQLDDFAMLLVQFNEIVNRAIVYPTGSTLDTDDLLASILAAGTTALAAVTAAEAAQTAAEAAETTAVAAAAAAVANVSLVKVRCATTAAITISTGLNSGDTIDGVVLADGDIVLVKDQAAPAENGIYTVGAVPARTTGWTTYNAIAGSMALINEGTVNADKLYQCTSNAGGTIGVTAVTYSLFSAGVSTTQMDRPTNFGLSVTVAANALTVALKGADGNDPSASNPIVVPFVDDTVTGGQLEYLTITAPLSFTISNGSTLGSQNGNNYRYWVVLFNDGGTPRIGVVNSHARNVTPYQVFALRNGIASSTAEGGAGAADSARVIYTGTAVASKAMTVLGYFEATEAAAGAWATAPSKVRRWMPGMPLPGDTLQTAWQFSSSVATGTTVIPADDTAPQNTEGDQYMNCNITMQENLSLFEVAFQGQFSSSAATGVITVALFKDAGVSAEAVTMAGRDAAANAPSSATILHRRVNDSATLQDWKIRAGNSAAGTTTFNGAAGARLYGGVMNSMMQVREIML